MPIGKRTMPIGKKTTKKEIIIFAGVNSSHTDISYKKIKAKRFEPAELGNST